MANRPADAGSGWGRAPMGDAPPPPGPAAPRPVAGHRAPRPGPSRESRGRTGDRDDTVTSALSWVPYLIVLASAAYGMLIAWREAKYAALGAGVLGASLLAAALGRLVLPARYAGLLSTRRKASDVLTFAVLGAALLAVALTLP
jgi:Protein of unknown function (DUF3017)